MEALDTSCVIVGGGPAGMMLGLILARAGLDVVVLEKHADFFRDFRGDTIHPSTVTLLGELGLRERFLALPHTSIRTLDVVVNGSRLHPIDFGRLGAPDDFLVLAPQWDFLSFLGSEAAVNPGFHLLMETEASDVIVEDHAIRGVVVRGPDGVREVRAPLTVAADGRDSRIRTAAGLLPRRFGVGIDVLWFHLPKPAVAPPSTLAYVDEGAMVVTIDRGDYYQTGLIIPKGGFDALKASGLEAFRQLLATTAPVLAPVAGSITDWEAVKLLSVQINRLERWYRSGLLAIGDAAHAMSPAFGVGVNYAVQDAVAAANALAAPLRAGAVDLRVLDAVQRRRLPPVARMQSLQIAAHARIARPGGTTLLPDPLPAPARWGLDAAMPLVQRLTARVIGRGFLPESLAPELREPGSGLRRGASARSR
ncbi:FAD-dependent oxidoreductase [Leifsonia poae]|uniref:FAD-dependent oxidoreductase n=1 Tax=Leifsonia poae TaxID=110933 RepID=UPI001CBC26F4|nr:FAD-dependent oxidoreductase [Leifsonia poae]